MNQLRFKLKDRVVGKEGVQFIGGKAGTVVHGATGNHDYGIQFDEAIENGHALGDSDMYKQGRCRWVRDNEIDHYNDPAYFADARVGDAVYDMACGEGLIEGIELGDMFLLTIQFAGPFPPRCFTLEGKLSDNFKQTLFYSRPVFDLPPPPKRKVKKVIEGWVNISTENDGRHSYLFSPTKEKADRRSMGKRLGEAIFIRHEYEVEE